MTVRQQREDITVETLGDPHQSPSRHTERPYGSHRDYSPHYYLHKRRRPPHDDDDADDSEDRRCHRHDSYSPTPSEEDNGGRRRDDRRRLDRLGYRHRSYSPTPSEEDDGGRRKDGCSVLLIPPPIPSPSGSVDNVSIIESMHAASQEEAPRHAIDILEVVQLEREQFERERQAMAADKERERAEFNAERARASGDTVLFVHDSHRIVIHMSCMFNTLVAHPILFLLSSYMACSLNMTCMISCPSLSMHVISPLNITCTMSAPQPVCTASPPQCNMHGIPPLKHHARHPTPLETACTPASPRHARHPTLI